MTTSHLALFPVEIWGTVGQWGSAIGTSAAAMAAAFYYVRDRRTEARKTATGIQFFEIEEAEEGKRRFMVVNASVEPVFGVWWWERPQRMVEYLLSSPVWDLNEEKDGSRWMKPSLKELKRMKASDFVEHGKGYRHGDFEELEPTSVLNPGQTAEVAYKWVPLTAPRYSVRFTDLRGQTWERESDRRLRKLGRNQYNPYLKRGQRVSARLQIAAHRWQIKRWLRKHKWREFY